eukprot:g4768.t1
MDSRQLQDKLSVIKPYTFYGNDPPRRLSKEPSKILEPLIGMFMQTHSSLQKSSPVPEWAEKTHHRRGGLAGHKDLKTQNLPAPPRRAKNAYKLFFEHRITQLLAKGGKYRRDEIQAMTPTIKKMWMDASVQVRADYQILARQELEHYEKQMQDYEFQYPDLARELRIKEYQRKARSRRNKESKKLLNKNEMPLMEDSKGKRSSMTATKKVSSWLDQLTEEDLKATEASQMEPIRDGDNSSTMDCDTESEDLSSFEDSDDEEVGYTGAYRFP